MQRALVVTAGALSGALAANAGAVVRILTDGQEVLYGIGGELRKVALQFPWDAGEW